MDIPDDVLDKCKELDEAARADASERPSVLEDPLWWDVQVRARLKGNYTVSAKLLNGEYLSFLIYFTVLIDTCVVIWKHWFGKTKEQVYNPGSAKRAAAEDEEGEDSAKQSKKARLETSPPPPGPPSQPSSPLTDIALSPPRKETKPQVSNPTVVLLSF
jgi:hypothetical protein